ncbi:MAG: hypothetical protein U1F41_13490 [Burkholderiales bacterium]
MLTEFADLLPPPALSQQAQNLPLKGVKSLGTYRSRLMQKLGIDNVAGLVRVAIRAGVIAPEA